MDSADASDVSKVAPAESSRRTFISDDVVNHYHARLWRCIYSNMRTPVASLLNGISEYSTYG